MEKNATTLREESLNGPKEIKIISGTAAFEEAKLKEPPKPFAARSLILYLACLVGFLCSTANGYDGSLMNSFLETPAFLEFFHIENKGLWSGIVANMYTIGGVVALPFVGPSLDQLGRRAGMFAGATLIIIGTIIQGTTSTDASRAQFMGGRFVLGFGVSFMTAGGPILVLEISHPAYRGVMTAWYNTFWFTGSILASGTARGTIGLHGNNSWLIMTWLQLLFAGVVFLFAWILPESPRWLYTRGKRDKCREMLTYWHGHDNPDSVWVQLQLQEYEEYLEMDGSDKRWWDYRSLFRNKPSVYRLCCNLVIVVFGQWAGNAVLSYYLSSALDTAGYHDELQQKNINLILNCVQFVTALIGARTVEWFGRRPLLLFANIGCAICWVCITGSTATLAKDETNNAAGTAAVAFIFMFNIIFAFGFTPLQQLVPVEVLSFEMRAKGMAFSSFVMNLAMLMNNYAWPVSMEKIGWRTYIIFAVWDVFQAIVIYFLIPETKNRTLEELDDIFHASNPVKASLEKKRIAVDSDRHVLEVEKS
ncbi:lactose permease protein [Neofusicoccum parvum]|uniref:Putative lactose permease protein n=1 Tax=Botryosphaeria parva (strain UCR-NP2) TaxID=1287680 RepID=R1GM85_BOTPV|nr:putative lactose permease protein [Neofusicoccum parvum UCRNP2]GME45364.1 lactose permease protein [Neofusicoccum parvum]